MDEQEKKELEEKINKVKDGKGTEKEYQELIDKLEKMQNNHQKEVVVIYGLFLHNNKLIHLCLMLLINIIATLTILGLFNEFLDYQILSLGISIFAFTIYEFLMKILLIKLTPNLVITSLGSIFLIFHLLYFFLFDFFVDTYNFKTIYYLFGFLVFLLTFRFVLSHYIKRFIYRKKKV